MLLPLLIALLHGGLAASEALPRKPVSSSAAGAPTDPCVTQADHGADRYNAGKVDDAERIWTAGYASCGPGHGFLAQQAVVAAKREQYDAAAQLVIRELSEVNPTPLALKLLIALKGKVSPEVTVSVYGLGRTPETAVHIPNLQGEYAWIRFLICGGKEEALRQSLATGPRGPLDRMEFVCPGASTPQTVYFEASLAAAPAPPAPPAE
ncbi:MAG: hypothetical protein EXR69_08710 [Myxococcales bacterium]|nr:hypothetical protein [Myxococcales bacterium]